MAHAIFSDRLPPSDAQPLSLGQYRLLEELGRGGMGRVYKARHALMDRVVAVKVISPELVSDPVAVEWFLREVRATTQLNHANIVMAYDANEAEGLYFLVMEYVYGMTLDALVKKHGPLSIAYACALIRQAALGLQHAHVKDMVHRDIKPGNLLVPFAPTHSHKGERINEAPPSLVGEGASGDNEVLVKILDFGLARLRGKCNGDTIALRSEAGVLGTPDYIAPEQSRDIHAADIRSDLYSLGCVFYFALTGHVPFPGDNAMEKLIKHLMEQPEPVEKIRPDVPPALAAVVRRLMAKDPSDRYQTPAELVRELEKLPDITNINTGAATVEERLGNRSPALAAALDPDPQPQHTCLLENIEIFAPSCGQLVGPSGPSLLGPFSEYSPGDRPRPDTHETLTLSPHVDTEEVTAEAIDAGKAPLTPPPLPSSDSDKTTQQMTAPGETASSPVAVLPRIDPVVFRLWCRWLGMLETILAERDPSRINSDTYQTIHALLLQACRAAIDTCSTSERRAFYEECLSIAQPWLKLQTFIHTDPAILNSLLHRCRQIEVELNNGKAPWTIRQVIGLVLLAASPAGAALWYWYFGRAWLPALFKIFQEDLFVFSLHPVWNFVRSHPALLIGLLLPLVIVFSIALLSRTPRS